MDGVQESKITRRIALLSVKLCGSIVVGTCISVEKRSVKAAKTVGHTQLSYPNLGREHQRRSWSPEETAHVCKRESQNSEGAKGAVGEGESGEEEWLGWRVRKKGACLLKLPGAVFI